MKQRTTRAYREDAAALVQRLQTTDELIAYYRELEANNWEPTVVVDERSGHGWTPARKLKIAVSFEKQFSSAGHTKQAMMLAEVWVPDSIIADVLRAMLDPTADRPDVVDLATPERSNRRLEL